MLHLKAFINVTQNSSSKVLSVESTPIQLPHRKEQAFLTFHVSKYLWLFPFFSYTLKYSATFSFPDDISHPQWWKCTHTAQMWASTSHVFFFFEVFLQKGRVLHKSNYKLPHSKTMNILHLYFIRIQTATQQRVLRMCCHLMVS